MTIVDASSIVKFILQESNWETVKPFLLQGHSVDYAYVESSNALWKEYNMRKRAQKEIMIMFNSLVKLTQNILILHDCENLMEEAFKLALREKTPIYDVLYIVLAQHEEKQLITSDRNQARIAEKYKVKIEYIL